MRRLAPGWAHILYNSVMGVASPVLAGYLLWRLARGKSRDGLSERWGSLSASLSKGPRARIWVHAASVGEVMAAQPILREIRNRRPEIEAVMSVITPGGREVAQGLVGKLIDGAVYLPFDIAPVIRKTVGFLKPDLFAGIETEIWPNLLYFLRQEGIPAALVNGRISDRSFVRYRHVRWFLASALESYSCILARTPTDAERFVALGAPAERVVPMGNVKFDQAEEPLSEGEVLALRSELRIDPAAPVWVVGSTRTAEEEKAVHAAHHLARNALPRLVLIHAPRHVERSSEVAASMQSAGVRPVLRSALGNHTGYADAIVLDTFGELARIYAVADVAFVGNSLIAPGGGQNPIQPLAQGKPVLFGPYMSNFRDVAADAMAAGVGFQVTSARDLADRVIALIRDDDGRQAIAQRALALIRNNRGAAARYAERLVALMESSCAPPQDK